MTNNDILKADMLDILFEHRNKDYGAYALRRNYNNRLWLSLGIGLSVILLLITINALKKDDSSSAIVLNDDKDEKVILKSVDLTPKKEDKPIVKQPEPPKPPPPKPIEKVATVKNTTVVIVKDNEADKIIRTTKDLQDKLTSTVTTDGPKAVGIVTPPNPPVTGTADSSQTVQTSGNTEFRPLEREPEYPGGAAALMQFLSRHLSTPSDLESGQKKMVRIRFKVDRDGSISGLEIEQSAGEEYDKEVIRVCKKMPRWKPAIQNGVNVPVSYVLPVTFIGQEY